MPSPFPGFDPYIENHTDWSSFHAAFIVDVSRALLDVLPPDFDARIEAHVTIVYPEQRRSGKPRTATREADVGVFRASLPRSVGGSRAGAAVLERPSATVVDGVIAGVRLPETVRFVRQEQNFIQIVDRRGGREAVVAVIEVLSPTNKDGRGGSDDYRRKQEQLLRTPIHVVEIDLLRGGEHVAYVPESEIAPFGDWDYLVTLRDADDPGVYQFWRVGLREALPTMPLPLTPDVGTIALPLQSIFTRCYDASRLGRRINYLAETEPPLSPADAAWADALLKAAGLRADDAVPSENEHEARGGPTESDGEWLEAVAPE